MEKAMVVFFTLVACAGDIQRGRISNGLILWGLTAGLCGQMAEYGAMGLIFFFEGALLPILLLGPLFYFRMLGSGDIKLFCVLGGLMGPYHILWCMWYAILAGAALSLAILFFCGGFHQRFHYLEQYVRQLIETGRQSPYYRTGTAFENIHFTIPIFMSVMLYTGGIY